MYAYQSFDDKESFMPRVIGSQDVAGGLWRGVFWLLALAVSLPVMGRDSAIKGTATYRERIAMPPNAVFEATLEDVSLADAPAERTTVVTNPISKDHPGADGYAHTSPCRHWRSGERTEFR